MISTVRRNFILSILSTHTKWITDCFFLILFGEPRPRRPAYNIVYNNEASSTVMTVLIGYAVAPCSG